MNKALVDNNETWKVLLQAFARAVCERRALLRLSQEQLAERSGLHRTYISDIERGARNLSLRNVRRLADALEMSATDLVKAAEHYANIK